jgi:hypothetical protein
VLPALGAATFVAAFWFSVFPLPAAPLSYFPAIVLGWVIVGFVLMLWIRARDPRRLDVIGQTMFVEADEETDRELAELGLSEPMVTHTGA